jgi:hypothetical protein
MCGENEGDSLGLQLAQLLPDNVTGLGIQAGSWFIQDEEFWFVDERPGNEQSPLHASGKLRDGTFDMIGQLEEIQKLHSPVAGLSHWNPVISGINEKVIQDPQIGIKVVFLGDHSDTGFDLPGVGHDLHAQDRQGTLCDRQVVGDHPHGRGLPCAVGAQETEAFPFTNVKGDAVDSGEGTETFG